MNSSKKRSPASGNISFNKLYKHKNSRPDDSLSKNALSKRMTLYIVEDDKIQSLILEMMVQKLGHQIIGTEAYGKNAVNEILRTMPDIVLLDVMLKDSFNGIDVAREIRQNYDPIIIYITGNSDEKHKSKARELGFHDYIPKPISIYKLKQSFESIQLA